MVQKFAEGKIVVDGACFDGTLGIIVYTADSEEEAVELFKNDPLVKSDIVDTELRQFRVGSIQKA